MSCGYFGWNFKPRRGSWRYLHWQHLESWEEGNRTWSEDPRLTLDNDSQMNSFESISLVLRKIVKEEIDSTNYQPTNKYIKKENILVVEKP